LCVALCVAVCIAVCVAVCVAVYVALCVAVCIAVSNWTDYLAALSDLFVCIAVCIAVCFAVCIAVCVAVSNWTDDPGSLVRFVGGIQCLSHRGCDGPEAVEAALSLVNDELEPPTRVLLIGDAAPHYEGTFIYIHIHIHMCIYLYMYVGVNIFIYVYIHTCIYVMYTCTYISIWICI